MVTTCGAAGLCALRATRTCGAGFFGDGAGVWASAIAHDNASTAMVAVSLIILKNILLLLPRAFGRKLSRGRQHALRTEAHGGKRNRARVTETIVE